MKKSAYSTPAGFTLVEVAIAMAVVAFGLTTMVALLPAGLGSLSDSATDSAQARIVQEISAQLQGSDWNTTNNLADFNGRLFYFDNQGNRMPAASVNTIFTTQLVVSNAGVTLPSSDTPEPNTCLREVEINLTNVPETVADRFTNPKKYRATSVLITKMSR